MFSSWIYFQGRQVYSKLFLSPSEEGPFVKGINYSPEIHFLYLEQTTFQKRFNVKESNREATKVVSLVKMTISTKCVKHP